MSGCRREFVYDATGRMSQAKVNGVVEMNYAYNAFGQQVAKFIAGQTTISLHDEAGHWLGDYDSAGRPIRQVVWLDNLPVAVRDATGVRAVGGAAVMDGCQILKGSDGLSISKGLIGGRRNSRGLRGGGATVQCETRYQCLR